MEQDYNTEQCPIQSGNFKEIFLKNTIFFGGFPNMNLDEQRWTKIERHKDTKTERQNDWKTERVKDENTERPKNRKKERQTERVGGTVGQGGWGKVIATFDLLF